MSFRHLPHEAFDPSHAKRSLIFACRLSCLVVSDSLQLYGLQPTRLLSSMGLSRQECQSGLPCPPPGNLPEPGMEPTSLTSPAAAGGFVTTGAAWAIFWEDYCFLKNICGVEKPHSSVAESKANDCMKKTGRKTSLCSCVLVPSNYHSKYLSFYIFITIPLKGIPRTTKISQVHRRTLCNSIISFAFCCPPSLAQRGMQYICEGELDLRGQMHY